jgi:hypothetical protein
VRDVECCPGIESQTNARTNSGFYTRHHINTAKLISVIKVIERGGVKPALLRAILRQHLGQAAAQFPSHSQAFSAKQVGGDDSEYRRLEDDDDDDSDDKEYEVALAQPVSKKKAKEKPTGYNELLMPSTNPSNAAGGKKGVSNLVGAALLALTSIVKGSDVSDLWEHSMKDYLLESGNAFVGGKRKRDSEFANTGTAFLPLLARLPDQEPVRRQRYRGSGSSKKGGAGLKKERRRGSKERQRQWQAL